MIILSIDVGLKNLAIARIHFLENKQMKILDWLLIDISVDKTDKICSLCKFKSKWIVDYKHMCNRHKKNAKCTMIIKNNEYLQNITVSIVNKLNEHAHFLQSDLVLIENQPAMVNPMIKSIQIMLQSYFVMNGVMNSKSNISYVQPIHASLKMKACKDIECVKKLKSKYAQKKHKAVLGCERLLKEHQDDHLEYFNKHKKKDDLADALLQAWAYVHH